VPRCRDHRQFRDRLALGIRAVVYWKSAIRVSNGEQEGYNKRFRKRNNFIKVFTLIHNGCSVASTVDMGSLSGLYREIIGTKRQCDNTEESHLPYAKLMALLVAKLTE